MLRQKSLSDFSGPQFVILTILYQIFFYIFYFSTFQSLINALNAYESPKVNKVTYAFLGEIIIKI